MRGLGMRWLLVGRDFRFGERRSGDFATLEDAALRHGFRLEAMPDVLFDGERVSSSAVRAALAAGDLQRRRAPARPSLHHQRARRARRQARPRPRLPDREHRAAAHGAARRASSRWKWRASRAQIAGVASVGRRPTVNPVPIPLLEVHLFDWDGDLYGAHLKVRFLKKLREEKKFDGLPALRAAIARRRETGKGVFRGAWLTTKTR